MKELNKSGDKLSRPTRITIILPTDAYFMSGIRDFSLSLAKNMTGFSQQWAYRFQSVVDELCSNAIEHGSERGQEIKIVFLSYHRHSLEVFVDDTGTGLVKRTAAEMTNLIDERKNPAYLQKVGIRGRGLPQIVASWTDELEFIDIPGGGLRVRIRKYLNKLESDEMAKKASDPTHLVLK